MKLHNKVKKCFIIRITYINNNIIEILNRCIDVR